MAIRITALGPLRVEQDGQVLDRLPARRLRLALLLFLGVEREATREQLMATFWGDRPPDRARHLLSQTLYELRQDLGESWMTASGEQVAATAELVVDVLELARAVEEERFQEALSGYGGGFLSGATLGVSREFEGWVDRQQARVGRLHRRARRGAADALVEAGRHEEALALAREWVELDPLDDEAQHRLIELLAATGDRSGALRQYERYASLVETQLELEPLEETQALVERIRQGAVGERSAAPVTPPVVADSASPASPVTPHAPAALAASSANAAVDGAPPAGPLANPPATPPAGVAPDAAADGVPGTTARTPLAEGLQWLRQHSLVRWTLGYLAGAVVALEGISIGAEAFDWPEAMVRGLTVAVIAGALAVLGIGGLRGERGRRRFGLAEGALLVVVATFALWALGDLRQPPAVAAAEAELDPRRIAVLYFDDHSPEQDLGPIAAGFTEALIHELDQAEGLEVLSRTAVEPYRHQKPTLDSIIRDLRPGTLVEGSITRLGDSVRVTFQLIDGVTHTHQMSGVIERPLRELHTIARALPQMVAHRLRRRLGDAIELRELQQAASTSEAWALVQRAQLILDQQYRVNDEDLKGAERLLDRADSMLALAEAADPDWPEPTVRRALVAAARSKLRAAVPGDYEPELARLALAHTNRALEKVPDYGPALEQRGLLRFEMAEAAEEEAEAFRYYQEAEADLRDAVELDPQQAKAWWALSRLLRRKGAYAEAKEAAHRAIAADAFLEVPAEGLFQVFHMSLETEELDEAQGWCDLLRSRHPRNMRAVQCELLLLGTSPARAPDVARSWALVDSMVDTGAADRRRTYRQWATLYVAKTLARAGLPDSARAVLHRELPDPAPTWMAYDLAHAHLMLGDTDRALEHLDVYVRENPGEAITLASDWWFREIRSDPRFERRFQASTEVGGLER